MPSMTRPDALYQSNHIAISRIEFFSSLIDGFCCREEWDDLCARKARDNCVNVCDCVLFGDLDNDGVVNLVDVARFQNCFNGADGGLVAPDCACADYDGDGDVDLADVVAFVALLG